MHLYKNLRIHQIFGANTDVGKTILGTALALSSANRGRQVRYLKPVSTGPLQDADDLFVERFSRRYETRIHHGCLFRFKEPVSPHLALRLEHGRAFNKNDQPTDEAVNKSISKYIKGSADSSTGSTDMYIETAGGVHSPSIGGVSQVDAYRELRFPTILVGDSKLGGISSTISSYESLIMRGYTVDAVLVFKEGYYRNWEYLTAYFNERTVKVASLPAPPPKCEDPDLNFEKTESYYSKILDNGYLSDLSNHLDAQHSGRIDELHSMSSRTTQSIWWPFVQHGLVKGPEDVTVIDSASGDFFSVYNGHTSEGSNLLAPLFDGSASWWTQILGHSHPSLALAAVRAAGRYGHVMFPQATHLPALKLAERLLSSKGPGASWASRVFFADNGSTAMEVAIKMVLRAYCKRYGGELDRAGKRNLGVLGLKGSYHGDTIGAMDASEAGDGVYTCEWHTAKGFWLDPPSVALRNGKAFITLPVTIADHPEQNEIEVESLPWVYNVSERLDTDLAARYRQFIEKAMDKIKSSGEYPRLAALVLEPLVMGAGGMIFVDPLFQRILVDIVRQSEPPTEDGAWRGLPVIFDEVFSGLYRLGSQSCIPILGVSPDVAVYAKALTGGTIPLAVTLTSASIFDAFYGETKAEALLHGHSYTAYAVGCEIANESLALMERLSTSNGCAEMRESWRKAVSSDSTSPETWWSLWSPEFVTEISRFQAVDSVMTMGTVLAIKLRGSNEGYRSHLAQDRLKSIKSPTDEDSFGIHFRTLGDVAYFMVSLNSPTSNLRMIERRVSEALQDG